MANQTSIFISPMWAAENRCKPLGFTKKRKVHLKNSAKK